MKAIIQFLSRAVVAVASMPWAGCALLGVVGAALNLPAYYAGDPFAGLVTGGCLVSALWALAENAHEADLRERDRILAQCLETLDDLLATIHRAKGIAHDDVH